MEKFNGKIQSVRRLYNSLRHFIGENKVHLPGDVLCVSLNDDDNYDIYIYADGIHTFAELYLQYKNGGGGTAPSGGDGSNNDGHVNTFDEIVAFLTGLPEGSNLKEILDNINTDTLTEEEKAALEDLENGEEITESDLEDDWQEALNNAGFDLNQNQNQGNQNQGNQNQDDPDEPNPDEPNPEDEI